MIQQKFEIVNLEAVFLMENLYNLQIYKFFCAKRPFLRIESYWKQVKFVKKQSKE